MQVIAEQSAITVTVATEDENQDALTPVTMSWKLRCITTDQDVNDWTAVTDPLAKQTIVVSGALNAIRDDSNAYEDKQVLIRLDNGLDTQEHAALLYRVRNLGGVT